MGTPDGSLGGISGGGSCTSGPAGVLGGWTGPGSLPSGGDHRLHAASGAAEAPGLFSSS